MEKHITEKSLKKFIDTWRHHFKDASYQIYETGSYEYTFDISKNPEDDLSASTQTEEIAHHAIYLYAQDMIDAKRITHLDISISKDDFVKGALDIIENDPRLRINFNPITVEKSIILNHNNEEKETILKTEPYPDIPNMHLEERIDMAQDYLSDMVQLRANKVFNLLSLPNQRQI